MVAQLVPAPHPILAAVGAARESLAGVGQVQAVFMIPAEQTAAVTDITALEAMLVELKLRVVAAATDTVNEAGARDTGDWLATTTHADLPTARAEARLAEALDRRWTRVAAGMAEGRVNRDQARVVVEALDALPQDLDPALTADAETQMVAYCERFRPRELRRLGRHLLEVIAPEIAEAELARQLENEEQRAREKTTLRTKHIGDGLARTTIVHPVSERDRLLTYLEAFTSPRKAQGVTSGEEDRIPYPRRLGQAFGALLEHLDPHQLPDHGGDTTTVLVTIGLDSLRSQLGTGTIVGGETLSASAVRRQACTAALIPVVLGGKGQILELGRTRRLFSPAQRKALALRDQHCRGEGCTVPARWCEAHHLKPWSEGGKTDLDDAILYCSFHHHRAHDPRYAHDILPDGDVRFYRRT